MPRLFGVDIAGIIGNAMGGGLLPCTVYELSAGARTSGSLTAGPARSDVPHTARGFIEEWAINQIDGDIVRRGDKRITVLGATIAGGYVPKDQDSILIEGNRYLIISIVERDPAAATYVLNGRI